MIQEKSHKTRNMLLAIGIPVVAIGGVIIFRNHIPHAPWLTETLGLAEVAPTAEELSYSVQTDPLGAVRTGGIITTVAGFFKFGIGKFTAWLKSIRDTATGVSSMKNEVVGGFNDVLVDLNGVKTDLSTQITGITTEVSTLKTDLSGQITEVKTSLQDSVGDIQALKEDATKITSTTRDNTSEILSLKELVQEQKDRINVLFNTLQEKAKDPLASYR